jgi:phosphate transport system permease protein
VKESAYAIGATQWEVVKDVVLPYSKLGVFGGVVLATAYFGVVDWGAGH